MPQGSSPSAEEARVERLSAELESLLLRELMRSWHDINGSLFRFAMRAPVLSLSESDGLLGRWDSGRRSIDLSRSFVLGSSWGEVLEVLKHEMAHQYAYEVLGAHDETAHGPAFQQVCQRIGIDAAATGVPRAKEPDDPERERVRSRVENLLALAKSSNQHEAETAAALAQKLMLKHNIAISQRPERRRYGYRYLGEPKGRVQESEHILAAILAEHFFVEAIWVTAYRPHAGKRGSVLEICGTPENLDMAGYVHAFLTDTAERLWRGHKEANGIRSDRDRRGYLAGVMEGFRERLKNEKRRNAEKGLVWVGDADLRGFYKTRHPHIRSVRLRGHGMSEARASGREAGRNIVLSRGISEGPTASSPRALPPKR